MIGEVLYVQDRNEVSDGLLVKKCNLYEVKNCIMSEYRKLNAPKRMWYFYLYSFFFQF